MSKKAKRVLPADMYDALELSAGAFGGIGGGVTFLDLDEGSTLPLCVLGHAEFVTDIPYALKYPNSNLEKYANPISEALLSIGVFGSENDGAVSAINRRRGKSDAALWDRVPFAAWCAELGVERGK